MSNVIESFFVSLGFEIDTKKIEEFKAKTEDLRESVIKIGAIFTGAAVGVGLMVMNVARGMDDVGDFADIVGMTSREVDALGKVAKQNDSSMEAMKSTIQGLSAVTGEAALGIGRGAMIFEKLGFSAKDAEGKTKGASDMLGEIADRMKSMNASERLALGAKLHIDPSLIPLLSKGSEAFLKLKNDAEAANPLTEEQYKQADEIVKLWNSATAKMGGYTKLIAASLFPAMKKILKGFNDWYGASKKAVGDEIKTAIKLMTGAVETLWDWVVRIVSAVKGAYDWLTQFKVVTWAAGAAIGALIAYQAGLFFMNLGKAITTAAIALFKFEAATVLPVILIGLLGVAIALVVDDLVNFYEGNESVIGQLLEDYPNACKAVVVALGAVGAAFIALKWNAISTFSATTLGAIRTAAVSIAAAAVISGGILPLIGMYVSMAASAVAAGIAAATAWLVAIAPIALVMLAIAAVAVAIYELWANWDQVIKWLGDAWGSVTKTLTSAFESVMSVFDAAKQKVMGFIDSVAGAIGKVGQLLGLTDDASKIKVAVSAANGSSAQSSANNSLNAPGGVIGAAGSNTNSSQTNTTTISGTTITVNSPDPAKAGQAVKTELDRMNKQAIRNGQSAVAL